MIMEAEKPHELPFADGDPEELLVSEPKTEGLRSRSSDVPEQKDMDVLTQEERVHPFSVFLINLSLDELDEAHPHWGGEFFT